MCGSGSGNCLYLYLASELVVVWLVSWQWSFCAPKQRQRSLWRCICRRNLRWWSLWVWRRRFVFVVPRRCDQPEPTRPMGPDDRTRNIPEWPSFPSPPRSFSPEVRSSKSEEQKATKTAWKLITHDLLQHHQWAVGTLPTGKIRGCQWVIRSCPWVSIDFTHGLPVHKCLPIGSFCNYPWAASTAVAAHGRSVSA